jgi:hypothetical protein
VSKSNKSKNPNADRRLKDSKRHESVRDIRHAVKRFLKEGDYEALEYLDIEDIEKE